MNQCHHSYNLQESRVLKQGTTISSLCLQLVGRLWGGTQLLQQSILKRAHHSCLFQQRSSAHACFSPLKSPSLKCLSAKTDRTRTQLHVVPYLKPVAKPPPPGWMGSAHSEPRGLRWVRTGLQKQGQLPAPH